jgi:hypothetical protein
VKPSDVAMYLPAGVGRAELQSMCGQLEADGYHSVWFTETDLVRDPLVHASAAAAQSQSSRSANTVPIVSMVSAVIGSRTSWRCVAPAPARPRMWSARSSGVTAVTRAS